MTTVSQHRRKRRRDAIWREWQAAQPLLECWTDRGAAQRRIARRHGVRLAYVRSTIYGRSRYDPETGRSIPRHPRLPGKT